MRIYKGLSTTKVQRMTPNDVQSTFSLSQGGRHSMLYLEFDAIPSMFFHNKVISEVFELRH